MCLLWSDPPPPSSRRLVAPPLQGGAGGRLTEALHTCCSLHTCSLLELCDIPTELLTCVLCLETNLLTKLPLHSSRKSSFLSSLPAKASELLQQQTSTHRIPTNRLPRTWKDLGCIPRKTLRNSCLISELLLFLSNYLLLINCLYGVVTT